MHDIVDQEAEGEDLLVDEFELDKPIGDKPPNFEFDTDEEEKSDPPRPKFIINSLLDYSYHRSVYACNRFSRWFLWPFNSGITELHFL